MKNSSPKPIKLASTGRWGYWAFSFLDVMLPRRCGYRAFLGTGRSASWALRVLGALEASAVVDLCAASSCLDFCTRYGSPARRFNSVLWVEGKGVCAVGEDILS